MVGSKANRESAPLSITDENSKSVTARKKHVSRCVRFREDDLVTAVHEVPRLEYEEIRQHFYSKADFKQFQIDEQERYDRKMMKKIQEMVRTAMAPQLEEATTRGATSFELEAMMPQTTQEIFELLGSLPEANMPAKPNFFGGGEEKMHRHDDEATTKKKSKQDEKGDPELTDADIRAVFSVEDDGAKCEAEDGVPAKEVVQEPDDSDSSMCSSSEDEDAPLKSTTEGSNRAQRKKTKKSTVSARSKGLSTGDDESATSDEASMSSNESSEINEILGTSFSSDVDLRSLIPSSIHDSLPECTPSEDDDELVVDASSNMFSNADAKGTGPVSTETSDESESTDTSEESGSTEPTRRSRDHLIVQSKDVIKEDDPLVNVEVAKSDDNTANRTQEAADKLWGKVLQKEGSNRTILRASGHDVSTSRPETSSSVVKTKQDETSVTKSDRDVPEIKYRQLASLEQVLPPPSSVALQNDKSRSKIMTKPSGVRDKKGKTPTFSTTTVESNQQRDISPPPPPEVSTPQSGRSDRKKSMRSPAMAEMKRRSPSISAAVDNDIGKRRVGEKNTSGTPSTNRPRDSHSTRRIEKKVTQRKNYDVRGGWGNPLDFGADSTPKGRSRKTANSATG